MTTNSEITLDQLVSEMNRLTASKKDNDGGFTSKELRISSGYSLRKANAVLRQIIESGLVTVRRSPRKNIVGEDSMVPVYFPTEKLIRLSKKKVQKKQKQAK
jgi:hypothetical protein